MASGIATTTPGGPPRPSTPLRRYCGQMTRRGLPGSLIAALAVTVAALLGAPVADAHAQMGAKERLVHAYSPIVYLRAQESGGCDTSKEQFEPTSVNTVLGNPRVSLVHEGPKGRRLVTKAPTPPDLADRNADYYLDLPGDPLSAGCTYSKDFARLKRKGRIPPTTYVHVARERGMSGFAVQYFFFYYFNQFNDVHEADWEGMQVAFDANTPAKALAKGPYEVALFQHAGGEKASWDDPKVQKRGTHPVVYAAAGSHATFYGSAVYVENGQHGSGVGCDNTSGPLRRVIPHPRLVPNHPTPHTQDAWLAYLGHWGQRESGFNNGVKGPITKGQWRRPFSWMEGIRTASPTLPGGTILGPATTGVFCGAVATVSKFINLEAKSSTGALVLALIVAAIILLPILATRWRPVDLSRLRQPRTFGQLLRAARQLYGRKWRVFLPIGLSALVIMGAIGALDSLFHSIFGTGGLHPSINIGGFRLDVAPSIVEIARLFAGAIVTGAAVAAVHLLERTRRASFAGAYGLVLSRFWRLVGGELLYNVLLALLLISVIGIPVAIWKFVDWQFVQQEILFEDKSIRDAFRGSTRVVRGNWLRTLGIGGALFLISVSVGPVLGFVLIFKNFSLLWVNVLSSVVFALLVPYIAIGRTLLYLDVAARKEGQEVTVPPRRVSLRRLWRPGRGQPA